MAIGLKRVLVPVPPIALLRAMAVCVIGSAGADSIKSGIYALPKVVQTARAIPLPVEIPVALMTADSLRNVWRASGLTDRTVNVAVIHPPMPARVASKLQSTGAASSGSVRIVSLSAACAPRNSTIMASSLPPTLDVPFRPAIVSNPGTLQLRARFLPRRTLHSLILSTKNI